MTVSDGHPAQRDDRNASVRAELLGQIAAAQFDLEAVIADLTREGAPASALIESRSQLGALTALSRQMAGASAATLATMRAEIASVVAASQSAAQQARATTAAKPDTAELIHRAEEARAAVNEVMRGMKDFDPHLNFADEREQAEYRQREADRIAYIAAEQAKGTPVGDLNASGAAVGQMADAAAHGAGNSPEFRQRWDALVASTEKLRDAVKVNGGSTEEFDRHLCEDLRRILKSKGLSDAQIDAQFAAHPDPLDAVKAYVQDDADIAKVRHSAERVDTMSKPTTGADQDDVSKLIASLQSAGVVTAPPVSSSQPEHGVRIAATPSNLRSV